jgi:hypothetical protein
MYIVKVQFYQFGAKILRFFGKKRVFILLITILRFTRFTPERQYIILPNISKPTESPSDMINCKTSQVFLLDSLAVPRLGNVQLRLHFLRRGTSGVSLLPTQDFAISSGAIQVNITSNSSKTIYEVQISDLLGRVVGRYSNINSSSFTIPAAALQKGVYIISLIDSEGKLFTSKIQR